jgi:hypothetical protein
MSESNEATCPTSAQLRKMLRAHHAAHQAAFEAWVAAGYEPSLVLPVFPEILRGLACGAKTRAGAPCKLTSIFKNGRCKLHGGMSTGPISQAGKVRCALNGFKLKGTQTP